MQLRKAERKKAKLKIGISAPSGAGKTHSSLLLAKGLCGDWNKVCLLDSENGSGELYSHFGTYDYGQLLPPFDAAMYLKGIELARKQGSEVVIIDSMTHFWNYVLEYQGRQGGRFQDWMKTNPIYQEVVEAVLQSPMHFIVCSRRKTEYEISEENGKKKVQKVGTKVEMRDSFEYELSVAFSLNQNHMACAEKDRTGLFKGKPDFIISENTGAILRAWAESGAEPTPVVQPTVSETDPALEKMLAAFGDFKVTREMIETRLGKKLDATTAEEREALRPIYAELSTGAPASKFFSAPKGAASLNQRLSAGSPA